MAQQETIPDVSTPIAETPLKTGGSASALPLRVGIIGCGAIAENGYLPAIAKIDSVSVKVLVDRSSDRASSLAQRWGVPAIAGDIGEAAGEIDAAIVATPNHLHAPISIQLLTRGIPVLVEKPMALNVAECDAILEAAKAGKAPLGVGFVCRFSRAARMTRELLQSDLLGPVQSFHAENGSVFSWPVASDFLFHRETAGGGVLIDLGSHVLDLLTWWLGPVSDLEHYDDSSGGVEADSLTRLRMESGSSGTVRFSRTCRLEQSIVLECERADLQVRLDRPALSIRFKPSCLHLEGEVGEASGIGETSQSFTDMLAAQVDEWAHAVARGEDPPADGDAGRQTAALIERCYAERRPWRLPWLSA